MLQDQKGYQKTIWTIGGGKGGSGKSFITANIGICLSRLGAKVILIDADLGGANLHTFLGILPRNFSLSDFVKKRVSHLHEVLTYRNSRAETAQWNTGSVKCSRCEEFTET